MIYILFIPRIFTPSSTIFCGSPPKRLYNFTKSLWSPSNHFPLPRFIFIILVFKSSIYFFRLSIRFSWLPIMFVCYYRTSSSSYSTYFISFSSLGPLSSNIGSTKFSIYKVRVYSSLLSLSNAYIFYSFIVSILCYNSKSPSILIDPSLTFRFKFVTSYNNTFISSKVSFSKS